MIVRAPATSANLGPGFDCAGVALELWNELELSETGDQGVRVVVDGEGAGELPEDESNLVVRAYSLLASPHGKRFRLSNRIPLERGLGSSAAAIALGLAAADPDGEPGRLLELGLELESHADNLAPALVGGVCLTWEGRIARIADRLPLHAVLVVPEERTATAAARSALPPTIPHEDASFTTARALLLGAAAASSDTELMAAALDDRLHEPYRSSALLDALRTELPSAAAGATLSGSGPSVVVWSTDPTTSRIDLERRFPEHRVVSLAVATEGALRATR
ncbi:MAG: homoserine kinase [Gaiellaceae bacterium]